MPSLKDLKNRINSVKSTRKITKAMQMVAAAKLRRAQEAAEAARPYAERMGTVLANLARAAEGSPTASPLLKGTGASDVHLLLVCSAERGLCGGFNTSIVRLVRQKINELEARGKTVKIVTVGKKGREQLKRDFSSRFVGHHDMSAVRKLSYGDAQKIADDLLSRFNGGEFDVAHLFFSRFQSVIAQVPTVLQVIPAVFEAAADEAPVEDYEYEPGEEAILADLLPRNIAVQIFTALLENAASEQGARMSAMDNATRNAGDMIDRLSIVYNRSRQAAITKELIEIISGAEAL
jgi:F-type H+-transporting ATPase subunit gamma